MDKVYRLLDWLTINQAVDWLQDLTMTQVSDLNLLQLCDSGQCAAYVKVSGIEGLSADFDFSVVNALGMQKALSPLKLLHCGEYVESSLDLFGLVRAREESKGLPCSNDRNGPSVEVELEWFASVNLHSHTAFFKSTDIQALASKMNGAPEQLRTDENDSLRQQLEAERAARQAAEERLAKAQDDFSALSQQLARAEFAYESLSKMHSETTDRLHSFTDQLAQNSMQTAEIRAAMARLGDELEGESARRKAAEAREAQLKAEAKPAVLLTTAALLKLLESPVERPRPQGMKQSAIKDKILEKYPLRRLGSRNLDEVFSAANKAMSDAE